jgi:general secretion pathway protein F
MPIFSYKATTKEGEILEGFIDAVDERSVIEILKNKGIIPLKVSTQEKKKGISIKSSKADLLTFTSELSALLSAGLPLDRSLNILSEISESKEMRDIVLAVLKSIREGSSFSDALQKHPKIFPRIYVSMIRAGEAGGVLDVVLDKLNEFLESSKELKEHVISSMIYPSILSITGILSIVVLLTYVIPKFTAIFSEIGVALPLPTQILLIVSNSIKSYWWIFLSSLFICFLTLKAFIRSEEGRYKWDALKLRLLGDVIRKLETARFCRTLGTLLKSGVPLLQALNNSKEVIGNQVIARTINSIAKGIKEGKGIAVPLSEANVFPHLALSMIKVGEETGKLDVMLLKVASIYEKGLKVSIKRFIGLLEPAMILTMGLLIGFIVVSMLMAIFSITEVPF